jgi:hypothetical protein
MSQLSFSSNKFALSLLTLLEAVASEARLSRNATQIGRAAWRERV